MSRQAHGLRAWLLQRFSAVYMAVFLPYVLIHWLAAPAHEFSDWQRWLADPLVNLASGLFLLSILIHAWVGMRDVVMDYVHATGLRITLFALVALTLTGCGLWMLRLLFLVMN
ncbi:MAG: succinate dehydrogenase, hydrophobic membrane anchor protein [Thiohalobacteraceae bacterium]|nr:succinate dehydrogenase, hydrophobic membrane anchor protein [Gammaproteobacteria bacterium]